LQRPSPVSPDSLHLRIPLSILSSPTLHGLPTTFPQYEFQIYQSFHVDYMAYL